MRVLLWVVLLAAGLWSAYWGVGSQAVGRGAEQLFALARTQGLTAGHDGLRVVGFPNRFDLRLTAPRLFDPLSGYGWRGDELQLLAMTWKPWHLIALAPLSQHFTTPEGETAVIATTLRGSLMLHPGPDLALNGIVIEAANLRVTGPRGTLGIAKASFATAEDTSRLNSHRIGLNVTDLMPDPVVSAALPGLPAELSALYLDAHLLFSGPLNRHAGAVPPGLTGLILDTGRLDWGPLQVTAKGSVAATSDGSADGQINLHIENWRLLPDVLGQSGLMDPVLAPTLLRAMEIMAVDAPDPQVLDLPLTFRAGRTSLGALPLGPAPRLAPPA